MCPWSSRKRYSWLPKVRSLSTGCHASLPDEHGRTHRALWRTLEVPLHYCRNRPQNTMTSMDFQHLCLAWQEMSWAMSKFLPPRHPRSGEATSRPHSPQPPTWGNLSSHSGQDSCDFPCVLPSLSPVLLGMEGMGKTVSMSPCRTETAQPSLSGLVIPASLLPDCDYRRVHPSERDDSSALSVKKMPSSRGSHKD